MSSFTRTADKLSSQLRGIQADIKEYGRLSPSANTREYVRIRKQLAQFLMNLEALYPLLESGPTTPLEYDNRLSLIKDLKSKQESLEKALFSKHPAPLEVPRNSQLKSEHLPLEAQLTLKRSQDSTISELSTISRSLRTLCEATGEELSEHNYLLGNLDVKLCTNEDSLRKVNLNFEKMIENASNSCLLWLIILLCVVLSLLILY